MKRSIAVVYVVGLFLLGIVIGALGMHLYDARHPAFPRRPPGAELGPGPGMWRDGAVDWLSQHLELTPEQKDQIVDIRSSLVGLYGKEQANVILATDGPTGKVHQPVLLWRQGKHTVDRLRDPDFKEPKKKCAGMSLDRKAMADKLEPAVTRLGKAYVVVALERRKLESTVDGKKEAFSEFDAHFRRAVRFGGVFDDWNAVAIGDDRDLP